MGQWQVRAELRPSVTAPGEQFDCYDSLGGDGGGRFRILYGDIRNVHILQWAA